MCHPGTYRHYKGGVYKVLGTALHSETQEPLVVYSGKGVIWVRPEQMFRGWTLHNGRMVKRFTHTPSWRQKIGTKIFGLTAKKLAQKFFGWGRN